MPILQLGDLTVWDSLAIAETVAERWPEKKLWPEDLDVRAYARSICAETSPVNAPDASLATSCAPSIIDVTSSCRATSER